MTKRLLLLSNSSLPDQNYLEFALDTISDFMGETKDAIFIPFAGVTFSYDEYEDKVNEALNKIGIVVQSIHHFDDPIKAIREANGIIVGGGNTFRLLERCYHFNILQEISNKVTDGCPYIGWSAGSNLAGPTICTTNDMPIIEPPKFEALNLINYQINPHYTNALPAGHKGETRDQRIEEYITINKEATVLAIPEGTYLVYDRDGLKYKGKKEGFKFKYGSSKTSFTDNQTF
ncbi:MAG: dipeptidase PepE [Cytophagales bacterium]